MRQKGFTLIELLVVVAIIGILAAVGVVAYNGYTASAKETVCKNNFKLYEKLIVEKYTLCQIENTIELQLQIGKILQVVNMIIIVQMPQVLK